MTLLTASQPLHSLYDAALIDLDGVVYLGPRVVPAAPEAVAKARAQGMRVAFVTNNASRTPAAVAEHLTALGVTAAADEVVTSAQAAARLIAERFPPGSPVLVVGDTGLRQAVRAHGLRPVTTIHDRPVAVVQGIPPGSVSIWLLKERWPWPRARCSWSATTTLRPPWVAVSSRATGPLPE